MTLRQQTILLLLAITILTLSVVGSLFLVFTSQFAEKLEQDYLAEAAGRLGAEYTDRGQPQGPDEIRDLIENSPSVPDVALRIFSETGTLLYNSPDERRESFRDRMFQAMQNRFGSRAGNGDGGVPGGAGWGPWGANRGPGGGLAGGPPWLARAGTRSFPFGDSGFRIEFASNSDVYSGIVGEAFKGFALASLVALVLSAIAAILASARLSSPLNTLSERIRLLDPDSSSFAAQVDELAAVGGAFGRAPVEVRHLLESSRKLAGRILASTSQLAAERDNLRAFLANASHELRTPLTAASNYLQLASSQAPSAHHEKIAGQLARMESILSRLLRLTRIDGGGYEPRLEAVPLLPLVQDALTAAGAAFPAIRMDANINVPVDLQVLADRSAFASILQVIFENALTHAPSTDGWLALEIESRPSSDGDRIRLHVADSGPGFPDAALAAFAQNPERPGKSTTGLGLGLAIAHRSAALCGASIDISNGGGIGTGTGAGGAVVTLDFKKAGA